MPLVRALATLIFPVMLAAGVCQASDDPIQVVPKSSLGPVKLGDSIQELREKGLQVEFLEPRLYLVEEGYRILTDAEEIVSEVSLQFHTSENVTVRIGAVDIRIGTDLAEIISGLDSCRDAKSLFEDVHDYWVCDGIEILSFITPEGDLVRTVSVNTIRLVDRQTLSQTMADESAEMLNSAKEADLNDFALNTFLNRCGERFRSCMFWNHGIETSLYSSTSSPTNVKIIIEPGESHPLNQLARDCSNDESSVRIYCDLGRIYDHPAGFTSFELQDGLTVDGFYLSRDFVLNPNMDSAMFAAASRKLQIYQDLYHGRQNPYHVRVQTGGRKYFLWELASDLAALKKGLSTSITTGVDLEKSHTTRIDLTKRLLDQIDELLVAMDSLNPESERLFEYYTESENIIFGDDLYLAFSLSTHTESNPAYQIDWIVQSEGYSSVAEVQAIMSEKMSLTRAELIHIRENFFIPVLTLLQKVTSLAEMSDTDRDELLRFLR